MQKFCYYCPTEIIFGRDAELATADCVHKYGGRRIFVLYGGGSVIKNGLLAKITDLLADAKTVYKVMGGVKPNPTLEFAREALAVAREFKADFVLAVGGGSVIDTAKAVAHGLAAPEEDIWRFWTGEAKVSDSYPVGVVLTIAAAGSETSDSAVLTKEATLEKRGLNTPFNRPKFAIMNPEITFSLPKRQIACGIVDIMMHTMDRYFTHTKGNELTDEFAEGLLRVVIKNGRLAMADSSNYDAMSELMWCGSVSHNGLTGLGATIDFGPHKVGHEVSGRFDVAHAESLSAVWEAWARYVYKEEPERFAKFGRDVWKIKEADVEQAALAAIAATKAYFKSLAMPTDFTELGIGVQDDKILAAMADSCTNFGRHTVANFKVLHREDVYAIYKLANH